MSELEQEVVLDGGEVEIPSTLPVLPLKGAVVFPQSMTPLAIGQERSIRLVDEVASGDRMLALVGARDEEIETPGWDDLYEVGTAAIVHKLIRIPDGTLRILVQGVRRIRIERRVQDDPYLVGEFAEVPEVVEESKELEALTRNVQNQFGRIIGALPYLPEELQIAAANVDDPTALSYLVASTMRLKTEEKQQLLETANAEERLRAIAGILSRELEVIELGTKIQSQVQSEMEKGQREYFLRQQLKAIQEELGEGDDQQAEVNELRSQLDRLELPEDVRKAADRELSRLEKLPPAAAEYGVIRTYLDWILTLPWSTVTEDTLDLEQARRILDEDHFDLEKVKDRIVEYLAVSKLKGDVSGPILCFVGPPGVGKTSLGQSIARTLGRKFTRISVGGVRDESEIRGHRRTYIGAMPGTIIRALRDAESRNPVFLIDEIDKMGADWRGDPASAMLEVLDPEQNATFRDHYLDLPFDLSKVLFICTANQLETIPGPLLDRMDVIQLSGYTEDEKIEIAKRYLVPKQLEAHGLSAEHVELDDGALRTIVREYTREAGLRNLERRIADVLRKTARRVAEGASGDVHVDEAAVREALGARRFSGEVRRRTSDPGVATGLAVTAVGGDVLFIEATAYPGKGGLRITGQLGDVMQESAQAALSWVRSHAQRLGIDESWFAEHDIHIHVPAGAVPKDGPSAGVTMATAIVSLATGRTVSEEVGMTGEITLTGQVLQIGGVREKVLAAQRAGLKKVVLPKENEADLAELPEETRKEIAFVLADTADEVLDVALDGGVSARPRPAAERQAASSGTRS
ncbi:MAG TPA: endopeptidase La [Gaiellaceae bacterium]|nr:endopeptidase La [Gaiellaceae bacterium]